ncbi:DMT family transporter [Tianweitania sp.]|uniref:DMT family transporter n=1 Tax=Tianweitania sp. TaxID=2021634 RepID=UPI00289A3D74|nr:DMT family transporter [Tianweitania sp.]
MALPSDMRGSLFMVISMAGFSINDSMTKLASAEMNPGQVMLIRGVFATILIGLLAWQQGALRVPKLAFHPLVMTRVASEILATASFLIGLAHLPLANSSAILQTLPLSVTLGAAIFLGEPIGWRRLLAIAIGFAGVLLIVRPGFEGFNFFALFTLASVLLCTVRDLSTSRAPSQIPSSLISFVTSAFVMLAGGVLMVPMGGWQTPRLEIVGALSFAAFMVLIGYQFVIMAMRSGNVSAVAPFRYTSLLWSITLGFLIFGDLPDLPMIVGSVIIVLSGIYTLLRERRVSREKPATASTGSTMAPDGV